jgi:hypothetical protein
MKAMFSKPPSTSVVAWVCTPGSPVPTPSDARPVAA